MTIFGKDTTMSTSARLPNLSSPQDGPKSKPRILRHPAVLRSLRLSFSTMLVTGIAFLTLAAVSTQYATAATGTVDLGTASSYAVLAGSTITNTGTSTISGDIGLSPGTSVTGFPPGVQISGATYVADGAALAAENDLTTAFNSAAGRSPNVIVVGDLGGSTLVSGVYQATSSMGLTGAVTLNGQGNADSVFIFQAGSTLTTASSASVVLENGAQACNVFWEVGSSATLGSTTSFVGNIMAFTSITLDNAAVVNGRVLAMNGAVTLNDNTITTSTCLIPPAATTTTLSSGTPTTTTTLTSTATTTTLTSTAGTTTTAPSTSTGGSSAPGSATTTTVRSPITTFVPTTSPKFVLPHGAPETGAGGSSRGASTDFLPIGLIALGLAGVAGTFIVRARRTR
jgi:hypothetical protein